MGLGLAQCALRADVRCGLDAEEGTGGTGGGEGTAAATVLKAGPAGTTFEIRLDTSAGAATEVYLWTGTGGAQCDSSGLTGTPYKIFAFRNQPPSGDVAAEGFGVADFYVDVESPAAPLVDTMPKKDPFSSLPGPI